MNFCEKHWASEPHGEETRRADGGGRMLIFAPEGETCGLCPEPATHTAEAIDAPILETEPKPRGHLEDKDR